MARPQTTKKTVKSGKPTRRARATQKQAVTKKPAVKTSSKPNAVASAEVAQPIQRNRWQRTPKAEQPQRPKLPSVVALTKSGYRLLMMDRKLILGIALWYGILNIVLVGSLSGGINVAELKSQFSGGLASGFGVFASLLTSSSKGSTANAGAYQTFLLLITSLALVWSFRQLLADGERKLRIRDSFYKGMYPLIPVVLVMGIISLQLIPMLIGNAIYSLGHGVVATALEASIFLLIFLGLAIWSLLLITPTIIALYIVSLPDMTPLKAYRSAKTLVRFRRPTVLRKILFLPLLIMLLLAGIVIPVIFVVPVLTQWVFLGLSILILPAVHAYMYTLYRELLNE